VVSLDFSVTYLLPTVPMAPGSTLPLVKVSTRNIPGGKGGRCVRLTTSPSSRAECHEIWETKTPGTFWSTPGRLRDSFTFTFIIHAQLDFGLVLKNLSVTVTVNLVTKFDGLTTGEDKVLSIVGLQAKI
jgi:hypothetical protein